MCRYSIVCLATYMQQIFEQYSIPFAGSREPMHWRKTIVFGSLPSDGRLMAPDVGPDADARRSNCRPSMTSGIVP